MLKRIAWILLAASLIGIYTAGCTRHWPTPPQPTTPPEISAASSSPAPTVAVAASTTPVPAAAPTATLPPAPAPTMQGCGETEGRMETLELDNPGPARVLPCRVYLPPCYDPDLSGGYPVLFLLHGQSMTEAVWEELGIRETADRLIHSGESGPFVIVMPREEYYLQDFSESGFDNALIETLLPAVAANYNISLNRSCRAIGGISRGASWALVLGWNHWKEFGAIGAHSVPSSPFSPSRLRSLQGALSPNDLPRLHIDIGESDRYFTEAQHLHALFDQFSIPHQWQVEAGAHNREYWQAHLESYLRWYAAGWAGQCFEELP